MGTRYTYQCNKCGYSAFISGRPDAGMIVKTNTFLCQKCKDVVDVVVEYREHVKRDKSDIGKCPKCKSSENLKRWNKKKRPCPKCDGTLQILPDAEMLCYD